MGTITHKAGRVAVGKAADVVIKNLDKDREKEILKLVDFMEKYMDGEKLDVDFDSVRKKIKDKDSALNKYINKALDETNAEGSDAGVRASTLAFQHTVYRCR